MLHPENPMATPNKNGDIYNLVATCLVFEIAWLAQGMVVQYQCSVTVCVGGGVIPLCLQHDILLGNRKRLLKCPVRSRHCLASI